MQHFQTTDEVLATSLSALGFSPTQIEKKPPKKTVFWFFVTKELVKTIHLFSKQEIRIEPQLFIEAQKNLHNHIFYTVL